MGCSCTERVGGNQVSLCPCFTTRDIFSASISSGRVKVRATITNKTIGGPGQCIVVSKDCDNPELAVKFLSFLNSRDEVLKFLEVQSKVPTRLDITAKDLNLADGSAAAKLFGWADDTVFWVDNSLYSTVVGDFYNLLPLVLAGKMTPAEFAADLDSKVAAG